MHQHLVWRVVPVKDSAHRAEEVHTHLPGGHCWDETSRVSDSIGVVCIWYACNVGPHILE